MALSSRIKVALCHSDPLISAGLAVTLREYRGFKTSACRPPLTLATFRSIRSANLVVADYDTGLRLLASARTPNPKIVLLTHHHSETRICRALEQGARGYLLLGCSLKELIGSLRSVHAGGKALAPLVASRIAVRKKQPTLTSREMDILRQLTLGLSNKAIAHKLGTSRETIKSHVKAIMRKLDASSRTEAAAIAQRRGIVQEQPEPESLHSMLNDRLREPYDEVRVE
jgi:DNA-binding NarL/FixJ family response regulator